MSSTLSKNLVLSPKKHSQCLDLMVHNAKHVLWIPNHLHPNQPILRGCSYTYPQPLDVLPAEVKHAESNLSEPSLYPPPFLTPVVRAGRPRSQSSSRQVGVADWVTLPHLSTPLFSQQLCHCSMGGLTARETVPELQQFTA